VLLIYCNIIRRERENLSDEEEEMRGKKNIFVNMFYTTFMFREREKIYIKNNSHNVCIKINDYNSILMASVIRLGLFSLSQLASFQITIQPRNIKYNLFIFLVISLFMFIFGFVFSVASEPSERTNLE
jgi:hypothetical protein